MKESGGGRVSLELVVVGADVVEYAATLTTAAGGDAKSTARIALRDGHVDFAPFDPGPPPEYLVHYARTFLRSVWREARKDVPWPKRINRWRQKP
jgi:hypothetical protein